MSSHRRPLHPLGPTYTAGHHYSPYNLYIIQCHPALSAHLMCVEFCQPSQHTLPCLPSSVSGRHQWKANIAFRSNNFYSWNRFPHLIQGGFFYWSALKMTKYEEKLKYMNWSANCSSWKVLSVNPQFTEKNLSVWTILTVEKDQFWCFNFFHS